MTSEQGKQERIGEIRITNCHSMDANWAALEVEATQSLNQRAQGDRTYHLLISFPAGENPSQKALKDIENRVCASIGYASHQRVSAVHYDTDNFHIHIAINKIHPLKHTLHEPFRAYKTLGEIAVILEHEHGLQLVNHTPRKVGSENRADDMEHHAGVESLLNWTKRHCLESIQKAQSWSELHQVIQVYGLKLVERGNGFIITDKTGLAIKASSVSRDCSKIKLEQRLGIFVPLASSDSLIHLPKIQKTALPPVRRKPPPHGLNCLHSLGKLKSLTMDEGINYEQRPVHMKYNTVELYARYQAEQIQYKTLRKAEITKARLRKDLMIEGAKKNSRLKRTAIQLMKGGMNKRVLYALTSKTLLNELEKARHQYLKDKQTIDLKYKRCVWADWLRWKATEGEAEALAALRSRESKQALNKGNTFTGDAVQKKGPISDISPDSITKTGTIIYRAGDSAIRDDGEFIKISRGSSEDALATALCMAMDRFGNCLSVNGTNEFKEKIIQTAVTLKLNISFDDSHLEKYRQELITQLTNKEKNHERTSQSSDEPRRTNPSRNGSFGSVRFSQRIRTRTQPGNGKPIPGLNKPNIGGIGQQPPPQSKNRLRELSQLGVVQLAKRSEMLLPSDVSSQLEYKRTQSDNGMRRDVFGAGAVDFISKAAEKYIAGREFKRQQITEILLHRRYNPNDEGLVSFAGIRQVDAEFLILLKHKQEIIVMPIDAATVSSLTNVAIGTSLKLTSHGMIVKKGRTR